MPEVCTSGEQDKVEKGDQAQGKWRKPQRKERKGEMKESENNGNINWDQFSKDFENPSQMFQVFFYSK